jgi:hypothetical protein
MSSFRAFLVENKFWWITPIVIVLLLVGWLLYKTNTHEGTRRQPLHLRRLLSA